MFHYNEGTESALSIIARGMGENKENEEGKKVSVKLNQFFLFCLRREFIHRLQKKGGKNESEPRQARLTLHIIILDGRTRVGRFFLFHLRSITFLGYHAFTFTYCV